ncbi:receptor-like serine/threonine-protein kinase NCRK [Carica papaya]|uniref:receptor-like serine/threonine-protein kinase NCRK n=1 Tax=Carica papaya TaxID=3649 RepID=UPI000B8CC046|nr:receptor-like serine/threonine-protein kinase NCRK [Carica papaya]XP_021896210.1 receptor-like serine/threonine-protein kinase NCRK [Carica papaya]XP_021896211.1 receptor-like serine/threonine-protein kinase NCRK [Carica papaya]XP_021896212.1 receptor-like serine/threonine-protein kinase NCRK [Carica papaya]
MKLQVKVALAFLIGLILIQQCLCDELSNTSGVSNWTCTCSFSSQGNQSYVPKSNCSTSCDCTKVGESNGDRWTCICPADGFPKVAADGHDTTCFTACNCTAGSFSAAQVSRNHISTKVVVIILLLSVILTTLTFLASVMCYIYRRDRGKCTVQTPAFLSDKETSCNSATNLINHKILLPEANIKIASSLNSLTGCFQKASSFCNSKAEIIHGTLIRFSYSELENATKRFSNSNLIGLGGSSVVYCGQLKDGRTVAVKRLKLQGGPDGDAIFSTEVELLSRLHHFHVVPLIGYCSEFRGKQAERLLVFEYMLNGNLRDCLDGVSGENMMWSTRVAIAIGAARGLEYLHEAAAPRILHRDVKSTNILLDENWRAKITDLGMAKSLRPDGLPSCSSSPARMQGTFGYFAPEYAIVGRASLMSDVFSFGVVLLELITGRQPIQKSTDKGEESLVIWATPRLQDSRRVIAELPDPRLKGHFPEEEMQIMAYLAKECLLMDPDARPTMSEVVQILLTIAHDKSRRRHIPVNLFRTSSVHKAKNESFEAKAVNLSEAASISAEQLPRATSIKQSSRNSLPLHLERALCAGSNGKEANASSSDYMERLILLTSQARSWRAQDDEIVDLTEPRLESFCIANIKSP